MFNTSFLDKEEGRLDAQNKGWVARKFLYSDELIKFYLMLMYYFRFDYRSEDMDIKQVINIPKNAKTKVTTKNKNIFKNRRRNIKRKIPVRTIRAKEQLKNKNKWKKDNEYGIRWIVEIVFSNFKRNFGHYIKCKDENNICNEILLKASLYNKLLKI